MNVSATLPIRKQLCFALYSASHAFTRAYRVLLEPLGLTYPQYLVLLALWERDGMRVKEIGTQLFLDSGTLTPLLKRLEAQGHVKRVRDANDERQVSVVLTPEGQALEPKAAALIDDLACLHRLDAEAAQDLLERIAKLRANLQDAMSDCLVPV